MATIAPEIPSLARDRAFETLYRRYVKDVYHYALALLRNPADAEDVTQTTFMNAYRAYKRGEEPVKPQHWLIKIAHNAARTRYATASRRVKEVPLDDHLDQLSVPEADRPDVAAVLDALGRLPLNQRAALVMRELEGRTYAEIADTLGVSVPAVETLIFRARRSLRLKASDVRVLGVVPLPASLAQLFESGAGVAVGGSAALGSGFLLKAAVAVVAGAVATGVAGGDRLHNASAAAPEPHVISAISAPEAALGLRLHAEGAVQRTRSVFGHATARSEGLPGRSVDRATGTAAGASLVLSTGTFANTPVLQESAIVQTTSQVTNAVTQVTSSATTLPVTVPQLPSPPPIPIQLPPPPPPPPLPLP